MMCFIENEIKKNYIAHDREQPNMHKLMMTDHFDFHENI